MNWSNVVRDDCQDLETICGTAPEVPTPDEIYPKHSENVSHLQDDIMYLEILCDVAPEVPTPTPEELFPEQYNNGIHCSTKPVSVRLKRIKLFLANAPKWRYALFFFKAIDLVKSQHISLVTRLTLATWLYEHTDKDTADNDVIKKGYDIEEAYKELYDQWTWEGNTKCLLYLECAEGFKERHKYFCRSSNSYEFNRWFFEKRICNVKDLYDTWYYGIDES